MVVALPVVAAALMFLLLAVALVYVLDVTFKEWSSAIPVIGGYLASGVDSVTNFLRSHTLGWLQLVSEPLAIVLHAPWDQVTNTIRQIQAWAQAMVQYVYALPNHITSQIVSAYINPLQADQQSAAVQLQLETGRAKSEEGYLQSAITSETGRAQASESAIEQTMDDRYAREEAQYEQLSSTVAANHTETEHWVDSLASNVQAFNSWATSQLQAQAASIVKVEGEAKQWSDGAAKAAEDYADITSGLAVTAAVATAATYTDTAVRAATQPLTAYLTECGIPLCDGLLDTAKATSLLNQLLAGGALAALVVAAITDPRDTAKDIASEAESLVAPLLSQLRGML